MALCFRFTSSTFSEILSMKPRISSTCAPRPGGRERTGEGAHGPGAGSDWGWRSGSGTGWTRLRMGVGVRVGV